jgi:hypothetical protein
VSVGLSRGSVFDTVVESVVAGVVVVLVSLVASGGVSGTNEEDTSGFGLASTRGIIQLVYVNQSAALKLIFIADTGCFFQISQLLIKNKSTFN